MKKESKIFRSFKKLKYLWVIFEIQKKEIISNKY